MARPKTFNEEDVLDKAVEVFWMNGYEATSMQDLVDAMGIQRGSLYAAFGSKQQLFLRSLERYGAVVVKQFLDILESKPSAVESIALFFTQLVEHIVTAGPFRSCLVTNSAIERGLTDTATKQQVVRLLNALEKGFDQSLQRALSNGEISPDLDLTKVAQFLTCSMQGLLVMGKVCTERSVLEGITQVTLSILNNQTTRRYNMTTFAVKRRLPGITMEQLGAAQQAAIETSRQLTEAGTEVKYIRSNFYPGDSSCTCIFEAINKDAVKAVNEKAAIPFDEITEVLDLVP